MAIPDIPGVDPREAPQPDIVPNAGAVRRPSTENRSNDAVDNQNQNDGNRPRRKWGPSRVMWCCGWIFCCPIFACLYAMREKPVDEKDMREDPCLPCYS